jgi:hypothetical protein
MISHKQLQMIHRAARDAGLIGKGGDDRSYRMVLRNVAGVASARELDHASFEDVMAVMEDTGFRTGASPTYWRDKVATRGTSAGSRMAFKVRELHQRFDRYPLDALCRRFSQGRTDQVDRLYPKEAWQLIEMLKAAIVREEQRRDMRSAGFPDQSLPASIGPDSPPPESTATAGEPVKATSPVMHDREGDFFNEADFDAAGQPF